MSYQYIEEIGRGGMGCVYKGRDPDGHTIAIKMMSNQVTCYPEYRALFQSEVNALRKMNHPSVVHIVGNPYQDSKGNLYLPMEFIEGETIEQYVRQNGALPEEQTTELMVKILDAIQYVHDHGCVHRDIKPSNIMLRNDGRICIIDFGIAKDSEVGSSGKTVGRIIGTDGYMSPEQADGLNIDKRTDIYSLGCVFYFMLTGRHAIAKQENDYKTVQAILTTEMPKPSHTSPGVSARLDQIFLKSVNKNMTKRYQTASEFKRALTEKHPIPLQTPTVTIGKGEDNDIRINNEYVSSHHLIIRGTETVYTGGDCNKHYFIEVEDISRNGTGINGRRIHHQTETIEYTATSELPQTMLAGRSECILNWSEVIRRLKSQGWKKEIPPSPPPPPQPSESLNIGFIIICLLSPLVGWILWGIWKEEHPQKASQASKWAWFGFIINLIITISISIS